MERKVYEKKNAALEKIRTQCATTCASNQRLNRENDTKQEAPAKLDIIACLDDIKMQIEIVPMTTRKKKYITQI